MIHHRIEDWDDAYANGANIPQGDRWPGAWVEPAKAFRDRLQAEGRARLDISYGEGPRNRFDLFLPEGEPKGLVVFVHGGFWLRLDKSFWSHLAAGPLAHGHAVAMPSYTLCPDIHVGGIVKEVGRAIKAAAGMVRPEDAKQSSSIRFELGVEHHLDCRLEWILAGGVGKSGFDAVGAGVELAVQERRQQLPVCGVVEL